MTSSIPSHAHDEPLDVARETPHHAINYLGIFVTLICLTVVTVAVAAIHIHDEWKKVLLALVIASVKGMFVTVYFMHLKFEGKLIYLILFIPLFLCICLIIALIPDFVHGTLFTPLVYPPK